jgi:hypothetical protein
MARSIEFETSCQYVSDDGIEIPTELSVGGQKVELIAKLDTGAAHCIFERRYGEELGLDVEAGRAQRFRTMAGSFVAYGYIPLGSSSRQQSSSHKTPNLPGISWAGLVGLTAFESESLSTIACSC